MQNQDTLQDERMSLFHLIKRRQRRERRTITHVQYPVSGTQTTMTGIVTTLSSCVRRKYGPILVDDEWVRSMTETGHQRLWDDWKEALDKSLTSEELKAAVHKGEGSNAPGRDGIGFEFFKATWDALKGDMQMFANGHILE